MDMTKMAFPASDINLMRYVEHITKNCHNEECCVCGQSLIDRFDVLRGFILQEIPVTFEDFEDYEGPGFPFVAITMKRGEEYATLYLHEHFITVVPWDEDGEDLEDQEWVLYKEHDKPNYPPHSDEEDKALIDSIWG